MTGTAAQIASTGADTATTQWERWSTSMQIVVTEPDSLALARREVDAELDAIDAAASRFRPDSEINSLAGSAGRLEEMQLLRLPTTPISRITGKLAA